MEVLGLDKIFFSTSSLDQSLKASPLVHIWIQDALVPDLRLQAFQEIVAERDLGLIRHEMYTLQELLSILGNSSCILDYRSAQDLTSRHTRCGTDFLANQALEVLDKISDLEGLVCRSPRIQICIAPGGGCGIDHPCKDVCRKLEVGALDVLEGFLNSHSEGDSVGCKTFELSRCELGRLWQKGARAGRSHGAWICGQGIRCVGGGQDASRRGK